MKYHMFVLCWSVALSMAIANPSTAANGPAMARNGVIQLDAKTARIHGQTARFMMLKNIGNICCWTDVQDWISWQFDPRRPGDYVVELRYSCDPRSVGSKFELSTGPRKLTGVIDVATGSWYRHLRLRVGTLHFDQAGRQTLVLKPTDKPGQAVMNLAWIRLIPASEYSDYAGAMRAAESKARVFVVPNFHPASCGWLTDWSTERNYCANTYLDHLDRVRSDRNYAFALSEVNNIIAIMNLHPDRMNELKARVSEGRTELVNGFFLEPTVNLSGGEALVKMGVEGIRWQQQVMGVRPRFCWMIDICGQHEQMAQIVAGLELNALVYCRFNPTGSVLHWAESPDGSRVLAICPGHYAEWQSVFRAKKPFDEKETANLLDDLRRRVATMPIVVAGDGQERGASGVPTSRPRFARQPVLVLAGSGDYSLAPLCATYPAQLLSQLARKDPAVTVQFATLSDYFDQLPVRLKSTAADLPVMRTGTEYGWNAFWAQCPRVKAWYRHCEHALQATEGLATIASLDSTYRYPTSDLYHAWLLMLLNMDRNTLWGAAGGMVFEHPRSWDARDRFQWVDRTTARIQDEALHSLAGTGHQAAVVNPLNWQRSGPIELHIPAGMKPKDLVCQALPNGRTLCRATLPSYGLAPVALVPGTAPASRRVALPDTIETKYYAAKIDPRTGALVSLKLKPSRREILARPGNVIVAEQRVNQRVVAGHVLPPRSQRKRIASSADGPSSIRVTIGPVAATVEATRPFIGGGQLRRTTRFYHDSPRIDFETELNDIPDGIVVVAEFPLADQITEVRRGIPYGFSHAVRALGNDDTVHGPKQGVVPVIRWSHYGLAGSGGFAVFDRGLTGRELDRNTPTVFLLNAVDEYFGYPNAWLSGKGTHRLQYAILAHEGSFRAARLAQLAWEYNAPAVLATDVSLVKPKSFIQSSSNVIIQAVRREGKYVEVRLMECLGQAGHAMLRLAIPHRSAAITDLVGGHPRTLSGGPAYEFPVRPQQIVTLRFETDHRVQRVMPLTTWQALVPPAKWPAFNRMIPTAIGHPPRGG